MVVAWVRINASVLPVGLDLIVPLTLAPTTTTATDMEAVPVRILAGVSPVILALIAIPTHARKETIAATMERATDRITACVIQVGAEITAAYRRVPE